MVNSSHKPLFTFIAQKIGAFLNEHPVPKIDSETEGLEKSPKSNDRRRLGFTFSFTYSNNSLSSGTMLQWDKGWDIPDAIGKDPCKMLQDAIDELDLPVFVSALTNDSVGTLMARAYTSPWRSATLVGAIFGTGTNAAYIERLENIEASQYRDVPINQGGDRHMVINTEWGAWSDRDTTSLPTTPYDEQLDAVSSNPKIQLLEKRVSGLYLGELARLVILQLAEDKVLDMSLERDSPLMKPYGINSSFLTLVAEESNTSLESLSLRVENALRVRNVSLGDVQAIQLITTAIVRRAARLAGAALAAIIIQSGRLGSTTSMLKANKSTVTDSQVLSPGPRMSSFSMILIRMRYFVRSVLFHMGLFQSSLKTTVPKDRALPIAEEDIIDIGIDGLLFEAYPTFEKDLRGALQDVPQIGIQEERRIRIGLAKDGSGVGAALVAQSI